MRGPRSVSDMPGLRGPAFVVDRQGPAILGVVPEYELLFLRRRSAIADEIQRWSLGGGLRAFLLDTHGKGSAALFAEREAKLGTHGSYHTGPTVTSPIF